VTVLEKNSFGSKAKQTVEHLALEEDLDYSCKRMSVDLENQDALGVSVQVREGCAIWSGGKNSIGQDLVTKTKD